MIDIMLNLFISDFRLHLWTIQTRKGYFGGVNERLSHKDRSPFQSLMTLKCVFFFRKGDYIEFIIHFGTFRFSSVNPELGKWLI